MTVRSVMDALRSQVYLRLREAIIGRQSGTMEPANDAWRAAMTRGAGIR